MRSTPCCLLPSLPHLSSLSWRLYLMKRRHIPERLLMLRCFWGLSCIWRSASPVLPRSGRRLPLTKLDLIEIRAFRRRAVMHLIAMPSLPVFLTISSPFIASPTPCCPFLPLIPLQLPLKKTRYPGATISEVPSLLVSCSPITSEPLAAQGLSRVSMLTIPLAPLTAAVRTLNVPNVSSSSRDLALAALCFLRAAFFSARYPRSFFRAHVLSLSLSSTCFLPKFLPSFFRRVGNSTPNTPRLLHRRHFCLLACALLSSLLSSLRVPRFPRRRCTNFAAAGTVAVGNVFALLSCITPSRCCH